jgi:hypothetical protein
MARFLLGLDLFRRYPTKPFVRMNLFLSVRDKVLHFPERTTIRAECQVKVNKI